MEVVVLCVGDGEDNVPVALYEEEEDVVQAEGDVFPTGGGVPRYVPSMRRQDVNVPVPEDGENEKNEDYAKDDKNGFEMIIMEMIYYSMIVTKSIF